MFDFKKSLGQNFLMDKNIILKIVNSADIDKETVVIEIGPGAGAISKVMASRCKELICYEIDERLRETLDNELGNFENTKVIFEDFLKVDLDKELHEYKNDKKYVVANLPYYITTPIINKIVESNLGIEKIVVMVQKEVAARLSAKPGNKDYGSLTVFLNYHFEVKKLFDVSKNVFMPKPKVDSSIVLFKKRDNLLEVKNVDLFYKIIRDSFQFKRKNIRNNLKGYDLDKIEAVLKEHDYDLSIRAEALPLEVYVDIANVLCLQ